jgi:hypothetical protein
MKIFSWIWEINMTGVISVLTVLQELDPLRSNSHLVPRFHQEILPKAKLLDPTLLDGTTLNLLILIPEMTLQFLVAKLLLTMELEDASSAEARSIGIVIANTSRVTLLIKLEPCSLTAVLTKCMQKLNMKGVTKTVKKIWMKNLVRKKKLKPRMTILKITLVTNKRIFRWPPRIS